MDILLNKVWVFYGTIGVISHSIMVEIVKSIFDVEYIYGRMDFVEVLDLVVVVCC